LLIGNTEALQDTMENSTHEQLLEKRKEIINKTSSIDHVGFSTPRVLMMLN
jgi:hypothetical protein